MKYRKLKDTELEVSEISMGCSGVDTVIAGARSPEHAEENAKAGDLELPEDLIIRLKQATKVLKNSLGNNPDLWQGGKDSRIR